MIVAGHRSQEALDVAERVRKAVEAEPITAEGRTIPVTISVGLAYFDPAERVPCETVIREADRCLYEAKQRGRNRVVSHVEERGRPN